jgi:XTP/dITP diphosphohydrolase
MEIANYHGKVEGEISRQPSGNGGFGYDPLFIPTGYSQTLADLGSDIKSQLSHRAKAIQSFVLNISSSNLVNF